MYICSNLRLIAARVGWVRSWDFHIFPCKYVHCQAISPPPSRALSACLEPGKRNFSSKFLCPTLAVNRGSKITSVLLPFPFDLTPDSSQDLHSKLTTLGNEAAFTCAVSVVCAGTKAYLIHPKKLLRHVQADFNFSWIFIVVHFSALNTENVFV